MRAASPRVAAVLTAGLAGALLVAGCSSGGATKTASLRATGLPAPVATPVARLTDTSGKPYDLRARTAGKLTLMYFGYTHCPDVCPTTVADMAAALGMVSPAVRAKTSVVFITTDPARDTPPVLRRWLSQFDPGFVGLTGSVSAITSVADALGVPIEAPQRQSDGSFTVTHGAQVFAFGPDGRAHYVYLAGTQVTDYAHDLPLLLDGAATKTT